MSHLIRKGISPAMQDVQAVAHQFRTAAAAKEKALTEAMKAAWGKDFAAGSPR